MLIDNLNVKSIFVGKDFKFGHQRRGGIDLLNKYHENKDIELVTFEPITKEKFEEMSEGITPITRVDISEAGSGTKFCTNDSCTI